LRRWQNWLNILGSHIVGLQSFRGVNQRLDEAPDEPFLGRGCGFVPALLESLHLVLDDQSGFLGILVSLSAGFKNFEGTA
jgi:hypothetical protein